VAGGISVGPFSKGRTGSLLLPFSFVTRPGTGWLKASLCPLLGKQKNPEGLDEVKSKTYETADLNWIWQGYLATIKNKTG
jgi:hypothetical protein